MVNLFGSRMQKHLFRTQILVAFSILLSCSSPASRNVAAVEVPPVCVPALLPDPTPAQKARLEKVYNFIRKVPHRGEVRWESEIVSPTEKVTFQRMQVILSQIMLENSALNVELAKYKEKFSSNPTGLWDTYFRIYDSLLMYSDGYREIFFKADAALAKTGLIGDYGFGTGNGCALLKAMEFGRKMVGADFSAVGQARAAKKMSVLEYRSGVQLIVKDILSYELPEKSLDGAIMNNVFYTIKPEERLRLLKKIFSHLKPGARFVLSDPLPFDPIKKAGLMLNVAKSSIENNANLTEQELAFLGYINANVLMSDNKFLVAEELSQLVREAGFHILQTIKVYYDSATMLILERPR